MRVSLRTDRHDGHFHLEFTLGAIRPVFLAVSCALVVGGLIFYFAMVGVSASIIGWAHGRLGSALCIGDRCLYLQRAVYLYGPRFHANPLCECS